MVVAGRVYQMSCLVMSRDPDVVARQDLLHWFAVARESGVFDVLGTDVDFDNGGVGEHDRSIRQRMRANGDDDDRVKLRVHNGATAGQRVGRGAGRGRYDHSVGPLRKNEAPIDVGIKCDQTGRVPFLNDDIVQSIGGCNDVAVANDLGTQHAPFFDAVVSVEHCREPVGHFVGGQVGQEAEPSQVDPGNRDIAGEGEFGRPQQGAIAADRDDEVASFDHVGICNHSQVVVSGNHATVLVNDDLAAARPENRERRPQRLLHLCVRPFRDYADMLEHCRKIVVSTPGLVPNFSI